MTEDIYHVSEDSAGVVSIYNNWEGNRLTALTKDKRDEVALRVGDVITVRVNSTDSFTVTHQPSPTETPATDTLGFIIEMKGQTIHMPFVQGEGTASGLLVTMHKQSVSLNASTTVTVPKEFYTDYIQTEIFPGDEVRVTLTNL